MYKIFHPKLLAILCGCLLISLFISIASLNIVAVTLALLGLVYFTLAQKFTFRADNSKLKFNLTACKALKYCAMPLVLWLYIGMHEFIVTKDINSALTQLNNFRPLLYCLLWLPIIYMCRSYILHLAILFIALILIFSMIGLGIFFYTKLPFNQAFLYHAPYLLGQIFITGIFIAWQLGISFPKYRKILFSIGAIAILFLFLANTRRTGQIIFMLCLPLFVWLNLTGKWRIYTLGIAIISLISLSLLPVTQYRLGQLYNEITLYQQGDFNSSNGQRLRFVKITASMIKASPIIGVGEKNYLHKFYAIEQNYDKKHIQEKFSHPHNENLYMWACFGIMGLILYLSLWIYLVKLALSLPKTQKNLALVAILACFISILFNAMLIDMLEGHFFAMLASCIILAKILNLNSTKDKYDA